MKILIATGLYPPEIGGPATYSQLLFEELPKKGINVRVLSFGEVRKFLKIIRHFLYFLKALKRGAGADVLYAQDPVSVGLPACLASKVLRKKFFLKIVGDYAWEQFQNKISNLKSQKFITPEEFQNNKYDFLTELRRKIERWVAKKAHKIIVPSEYLKKIVLMWGAEEEKISVIYNACDTIGVSVGNPISHRRGFSIISIGRLVPWKGFSALIEIMPEILKQIPEAKLVIIGSGPEENNLKSKIENLKLEKEISLLGQLQHEEVLQRLENGDVFVLNTGYEGLSHQILEAMAVGIPIITTNVGGNPELIKNNESGFLVEYNNKGQLKKAILELYNNKDLREKFIQNARKRASEFGKEKMIDKTTEVLFS